MPMVIVVNPVCFGTVQRPVTICFVVCAALSIFRQSSVLIVFEKRATF